MRRAQGGAEGSGGSREGGNFGLFRARGGAENVFSRMWAAGVLIRNLNRPGLLADCLRVTIGTPAENTAFLKALLSEPAAVE